MQESRAPQDISASKQILTRSKFVEPSISDAVGAPQAHSCQLRADTGNLCSASVSRPAGLGPARLLCANRRPEQVQQIAAYSITSSAMLSSPDERVRSSALAVFILITNSDLVGCWIGSSL